MMRFRRFRQTAVLLAACACMSWAQTAAAQVDEDQLGAWYMYFFNKSFDNSQWGFQGDVQFRNWDLGGDLEQLLLRAGGTYRPKRFDMLLTLGYGNITSGVFGPEGATVREDRVYQEVLLPQKLGEGVFLRHRFRYEQRWVENQDFRTRFRYALFVDIPLNGPDLKKGAWYLAFYNELFINGQTDIGDGRTVDRYDRNRLYGAVGYSLADNLRFQGGYTYQHSNAVSKGQLQFSLHHSF